MASKVPFDPKVHLVSCPPSADDVVPVPGEGDIQPTPEDPRDNIPTKETSPAAFQAPKNGSDDLLAGSLSPAYYRCRYGDKLLERCLDVYDQSKSTKGNGKRARRCDPLARKRHTNGSFLCCWLPYQSPKGRRCDGCEQFLEKDFKSHQRYCKEHKTWTVEAPVEITTGNIRQWAGHWESCLGGEVYLREPCLQAADMGSDLSTSSVCTSARFHPEYAPTLLQVHYTGHREYVTDDSYRDERTISVYTKDRVWEWNNDTTNRLFPRPIVPVPETLNPVINSSFDKKNMFRHGGGRCDVWTMTCASLVDPIKERLDELARITDDRPIPRYQMIIDPNQFVLDNGLWVPSEFDVSAEGEVRLVGGPRSHWLSADLIGDIAEPILKESLPLLSKLRKPSLLLEQQRLQVVVKAQRIILPPKKSEDNDSEYVGLWHVDGERENVAAVVLFYYRVSPNLLGGNMEFIDRSPLDVVGSGDCNQNAHQYQRQALRAALRPGNGSPDAKHANCSIPINEGTLLVFSNYQMAHRVLRMINTSEDSEASRDFVALFVIDPAGDPLVPARCHLAKEYIYKRTLSRMVMACPGEPSKHCLPDLPLGLVLEYLGVRKSTEERRRFRNSLLKSQLQPRGYLGGVGYGVVYSTGNGCFTMLGWINDMLTEDSLEMGNHRKASCRTEALNVAPMEVGRGLSETLSIPSENLGSAIDYERHCYENEHLLR